MRQLFTARAVVSLMLLLPFALAGCSGNDGGNEPDAGNELPPDDPPDAGPGVDATPTAAPAGTIAFPPRRALTDQTSLRIRGTASDDIAVAAVRVNGLPATSLDGFASWHITIPLTAGVNTVTLEVEDITGNVTSAADEVEVVVSQSVLAEPRDLALDNNERTLYVTDESQGAVFAIDMATGVRTVVSDGNIGAGPAFGLLRAIDLDLDNDRALVLDGDLDAVFAVDLVSGDRSILTSSTVGSGQTLLNARSIIVDSPNGRALVADSSRDALFAVDLTSGDRTVIAAPGTGVGIDLVAPRGMALDAAQNRVLILDASLDALLAIDLTSGDRTIISDDTTGAGFRFDGPASVVLSPTPGQALVVERDLRGLLQVDLTTGDRELISSGVYDLGKTYVGSGPLFGRVESAIMDPQTGLALVLDSYNDLVISVDPGTGRRAFLWGDTAHSPSALVTDGSKTLLWAVDGSRSGVVSTGLDTGVITVVADDDIGDGPAVTVPHDAIIDEAGNRLLFTDAVDFDDNDWYSALTSVDLSTGDRTHIAKTGFMPYVGAGPQMQHVVGLAALGDRFFATRNGGNEFCDTIALMDIALATGDRTFLSQTNDCGQPVLGAGPDFNRLTALLLEPGETHALAADAGARALVRIELATGDREIVSDDVVGAGPSLSSPVDMELDESDPNKVLLIDSGLDALLSIDLATGDRTVLSDAATGNGPGMQAATSLAFDRDTNVILVGEGIARGILGGVYMIDRESGERVFMWP